MHEKLLRFRLDIDIQGHGVVLVLVSNLPDFGIDIDLDFLSLDVHITDTWNSHERFNS